MKVSLERNRVVLIPEGSPDELYLEQVLGVGKGGHGSTMAVHPPPQNAPKGTWGSVSFQAAPPPEPPPPAPPPTPAPE